MDNDIKDFIQLHMNLIDDNKFQILYTKARESIRGRLTQTFLDAEINPPDYMTYIPMYGFAETNIKSYSIPDGIEWIEDYAFMGCEKLSSITIPDSVKSIREGAFYRCKTLESVVIPDSVELIGPSVFSACWALTDVTIGSGTTMIGKSAFAHCQDLTSIKYKGTKEQWKKISKNILWNEYCAKLSKVKCIDGSVEV